MKRFLLAVFFLAGAGLLTACDSQTPEADNPPRSEKAEVLEDRLSRWMGQWNGPEGTYLKLEKSGEGYGVTIKDLDKEQRYLGVASNMRIRFNRENKEEYLRLVPGSQTGMKWLADKPYCLMIRKGEAFCRDAL